MAKAQKKVLTKTFAIVLNDKRTKLGVKVVPSKDKATFARLCALTNFQAAIIVWSNGSKKVIKGSLPEGLEFKK